jgi:prepilin-type N-terminal cleavage/methylation domain-containing protein
MTRRRVSGGFSLIELAIVMIIGGLLLSGVLRFYSIQMEKARFDLTQQRLGELRSALIAYVVMHERLPCPESPSEAQPAAGDAACAADAMPPAGVIAFSRDSRAVNQPEQQVWIGAVPVRALRLAGEQGLDGWGNRFTYAVARRLTLTAGMRGNPLPAGVITLLDAAGRQILDAPDTGRFVIVSHGRTGEGAYMPGGQMKPCGQGTLDSQNCDGDSTFVVAPFTLRRGANFYDDLVIYDDLRAGGTLLDRLVICNAKKSFYAPADRAADVDGCMPDENIWRGACLLPITVTEEGEEQQAGPPRVLLRPAAASGMACVCTGGYRAVKISAWYDGPELQGPWIVMDASPAGISVGRKTSLKKTALYTCVR